jgi:anti-anti-sigma factor
MAPKPRPNAPSHPAARDCSAGLRWRGPLDGNALAEIQLRVDAATGQGCRALIFDLAEADYIDSRGVRWLEDLHRELQRRHGGLQLQVLAGSSVERTLRLLGVDEVLEISSAPESP